MNSSPSLAGRAVLAVILMVGFYLLALAIAAALLYLPYAEVVYAHRLHFKLAFFCVVGAGAILWSVFPRIDRFEPPGPRLTPDQHPRLFTELEGVARATQQAMPAEVYLVPDVNAWVAQRGGIMGFGSRRVMGLGLPLLRLLTCAQFRAVLAHEFGHYHGGDTKLGPWIFKTRNAIGRTLASLSGDDGKGSLLQMPFLLYGKMFLRITHAISRRQEFVADELAARTVGAKPLADGLRMVHGAGMAFGPYWQNECAPLLRAGFRPPLVEGFERFVQARPIVEAIRQQLDSELQSGKTDPYDTHPPLKERLAAIAPLPAGDAPANDPTALALLDGVPALEQNLLVLLAGETQAAKLRPIAWNDVVAQVYLPLWTNVAGANAAQLRGISPESLPSLAADLKALGRRFVTPSGEKPDDDSVAGFGGFVIGAALAVSLAARGIRIESIPGEPIFATVGEVSLQPFSVMSALASGEMNGSAWAQHCAAAGLVGADLGATAVSGSANAG